MCNFYTKFTKILDFCKSFSKNLVNEKGNVPRVVCVPRFSDLEVVALSLTAEALSLDSENNLFICKLVPERIDGKENFFCIDSQIVQYSATGDTLAKRCSCNFLNLPAYVLKSLIKTNRQVQKEERKDSK